MTDEPLSAEDARILALESGNVRGHTCKVIVIGGEHGAAELRDHLSQRIPATSRLRQRLAPAPGPPRWVEDSAFSVERHVCARDAADDAELRRLVGEVMAAPLDRDRPLWAMDVVSPLAGGRTALIWRIHHAMADGMTAMRMARELILEPAQTGRQDAPSAGRSGPPPSAVPTPAVLRHELGRRASRSPLDRPVGPRREVAFADAPLEQLRRIGHSAPERATVNDVVLAAVAGGLRGWLEALGAPAEGIRVKVPVSLHRPEEGDAANRDSFMVVDLPLDQSEPLERLRTVARETRETKRRHEAQALDVFFRDLSHLSGSLERFAEHWAMSPRVFTLNVSNVPGPGGPQRVLGSPLLEFHSLAEIAHRHALRVAVVSAADRISFGLCADPDAVDRLDLIARGIDRELQVLASHT